jgi:hypothetical protein
VASAGCPTELGIGAGSINDAKREPKMYLSRFSPQMSSGISLPVWIFIVVKFNNDSSQGADLFKFQIFDLGALFSSRAVLLPVLNRAAILEEV